MVPIYMHDRGKVNRHVKHTCQGKVYIEVFTYLSYRADRFTCLGHVKIHANLFTVGQKDHGTWIKQREQQYPLVVTQQIVS
jgi:hypothetical protein